MRIRKRFAVLAVAAVLLAALLTWRLLPRTFSQVSGSDGRLLAAFGIACS